MKGSSCTASSKSISCRFIKAQPHYFDGLSTNDKVLKEYLTVDWEKTYDPEDADDFFAYENSDDISTMGPDDIAAAIKGKPEVRALAGARCSLGCSARGSELCLTTVWRGGLGWRRLAPQRWPPLTMALQHGALASKTHVRRAMPPVWTSFTAVAQY